MAITYNLPLDKWYFDTTSEWTLDYPPLFAAFEFILALFAHIFNLEAALALSESPIRKESVIVFQKLTVIFSDWIYFYSVYKLCGAIQPLLPRQTATQTKGNGSKFKSDDQQLAPDGGVAKQQSNRTASDQSLIETLFRPDASSSIALLLILQPGLILVDHIHFQYNGFLSGILLLSIANIIERKYILGSFWFAILLNLKHIYLYCAPAYGMYLLAGYCLAKVENQYRIITLLGRAGRLGSVVLAVFLITFAPFGDRKTLEQILKRLFPFKRGLTHAYWAPNAWSLYNLADKILATVYKDSIKVTFDLESISKHKVVTSTSGLVQEYEHQYLPSVKPLTTFIIVGALVIPIVLKFMLRVGRISPRLFMKGITVTAFTSFMFGWHVHEKAIILTLLPLVPITFTDPRLKSTFSRLTLAGTYSLFPLIFEPAEYLTKIALLAAYYCYSNSITNGVSSQSQLKQTEQQSKGWIRKYYCKFYILLDKAFILAILINELYVTLVHGRLNYAWNPLARLNKYEFLPLMMTSSLSAAGIATCYLELYYDFLVSPIECS